MGTPPSPVNVAETQQPFSPFVARVTPAIERANRLISVTSNPGFLDVLRISEEMVQDAVEATSSYPGWDPVMITILKVRQQVAKELQQTLVARIQEAIQNGIAEANDLNNSAASTSKSAAEAIDESDFVRQRVLHNFDQRDSRTPGSY